MVCSPLISEKTLRDSVVVIALTSYQCGPGLILDSWPCVV